jgi:hypothetical protein
MGQVDRPNRRVRRLVPAPGLVRAFDAPRSIPGTARSCENPHDGLYSRRSEPPATEPEGRAMPYIIAAAFIIIGGALSFGMAGKKLKRPKRWRRKKAASEAPKDESRS